MTEPRPVRETDAELEAVVRRYRRLGVISAAAMGALLLCALVALGWLVIAQRQQMQRNAEVQCTLFASLGSQPTTVLPGAVRASRYGTNLVLTMHRTAEGLHCPGVPALPSQVTTWARYYHLRP